MGLVAAIGCGGSRSDAPVTSVSDSAGVRFVEHGAYDAASFELTVEPIRRLGVADGSLPLFRVAAGTLTPSGEALVADAGNYRVLRWSSDGAPLGAFGSQGDGPGEFQTIAWMHAVGSTLVLYDSRLRRISWFDMAGELLRTTPFAVERPEPPTPDAIVASGSALTVTPSSEIVGYPLSYADPDQEAGVLPLRGDLQLYDSTSAPLRPIGRFTLVEWYEDPTLDRFPIANRMETPVTRWAGRDGFMAMTDPAAHRVDVLTDGVRSAVIRESRARIAFEPDSIPEEYDLAADSLQAYRDVRIDGEHRVWVRPAVADGVPVTRWRVFSRTGDRLGDLELPADATVLDATASSILLLRRSALDEESVEVWGLRSPVR